MSDPENKAPGGWPALTATELAEMWRRACADWNDQVGAHPDPWEHFAKRLAAARPAPAEGDALPTTEAGWLHRCNQRFAEGYEKGLAARHQPAHPDARAAFEAWARDRGYQYDDEFADQVLAELPA